jgi:arylsulfatase A-like enzyme
MNVFKILLPSALLITWFPLAAAERPPDILVLMAEDLSARVGAFGDDLARTPNLDTLAAEGVRFPNTFTAAGVCAPSRAAFITGVHQISLGAQHMRTATAPVPYRTVPPPEVKAFPELLRGAGYHTFTNRKLDYQFSGPGAGSGPPSIWDAEGAADHLAALPADRPFFGLINLLVTHESNAFEPDAAITEFTRQTAARSKALRSQLPERTPRNAVVLPPYYPDTAEVRAHLADHYDNVQLMDAEAGRILQRLAAAGRLADTVVIWTTDHGDGLPRAKRELYDAGIRVPMIIRWPEALRPEGLAPGALDERLISFIDLAPLILDLAGVPRPEFLQGRNPFHPESSPRQYIYASRDRIDQQDDRVRAVRDARFKYLRFFNPGTPGAVHLEYRDQGRIMQALWQGLEAGTLDGIQRQWFEPRPVEALYDLETDPWEIRNLADDPEYLPVLTRLRAAYAAWRLRVPDLSDQTEAAMAESFWPGGIQPETPPPALERQGETIAIRAADQASVEYRMGQDPWRLYVAPVPLPPDEALSARAVRYGWSTSSTVTLPPAPESSSE